MIDLHSHTTHSDGQRTPDELFDEARAAGVTVLSVTDHDTVAGVTECQAAARRTGLTLVPGIELSAELNGREVHVLGHLFDPASPALHELQTNMLAERRDRMERMVHRAQAAGLRVTMEQVIAHSGGENLGRPHLARALVQAGHAESVKDAFDRFLKDRGPLFVDRQRLDVADAIDLVHRAGGTASLAHPGANKVSKQELKLLAELSLDAVEALHPEHVLTQSDAYERWAQEWGLLVTAGSDYHGPAVQPDRKLAARTLSAERFHALQERARGHQAHKRQAQ
ncbi:MAG: PHP domain-containing protein [Deltaproteobacteria bacterium]|nr:PHP domain-containing protein [Deltaproteobacteria bacterium]